MALNFKLEEIKDDSLKGCDIHITYDYDSGNVLIQFKNISKSDLLNFLALQVVPFIGTKILNSMAVNINLDNTSFN